MRYYLLEPEVAGGFGNNAVIDTTTHPPNVKHLHYELDGWLGDDLLETFPCYIVTDRLRQAISEVAKRGFSFADVEISKSEQFRQFYRDRELPAFSWLKVSGQAGVDDLGISANHCLVVSERVLAAMQKNGNLKSCDIMEYG